MATAIHKRRQNDSGNSWLKPAAWQHLFIRMVGLQCFADLLGVVRKLDVRGLVLVPGTTSRLHPQVLCIFRSRWISTAALAMPRTCIAKTLRMAVLEAVLEAVPGWFRRNHLDAGQAESASAHVPRLSWQLPPAHPNSLRQDSYIFFATGDPGHCRLLVAADGTALSSRKPGRGVCTMQMEGHRD